MENNVIRIENYQAIQESHSTTLEETIERLTLKGLSILEFEPIFKNAKRDDWDYEEEESESYFGNNGEDLKGYLLYNSQEFYKEGMDGSIEMEKEIFLTNEGTFLAVYTVTEFDYCHQCEQIHYRLHRIIAEDQSLSHEETEAVLNHLAIELDEELMLFE